MRVPFLVLLGSALLLAGAAAGCGGAAPAVEIAHPLEVPADAPSRGNARAPITVQVFTDFQCPYCRELLPTLDRIERDYPDRVRIVYRSYPIPGHAHAELAAIAAIEVHQQRGDEAFWRYHDLLFENQRELGTENLVALAARVPGADVGRLGSALADHRHRAAIDADMAAVTAAGMSIGTPSFLIGDELLSGAQPFERFQTVIDAHLAGI